jgi:probable phosphoglycerate mutase
MKCYFVRHGETVLNREKIHQFPDTPLSEIGLLQAKAIARRFTHIPIDIILTSSYLRAIQTAQEIEKVKSVPVIQNDLLTERLLPSFFRGKPLNHPEILSIHATIRENFGDPDWHYSNEENFTDLRLRAEKTLDLIVSHQKDNAIIVTHGYFLAVMIFSMLFEKGADSQLFLSFIRHMVCSNTGLTMCEFKNNEWKLLTWNDYAHLGE